jgi:hypothetical protein
MAKSSGLGATFSIDDGAAALQNVSNDILSFNLSTPRGSADITGLDKSAVEKLLLLADGKVSITGAFNPTATTGLHTVLRTISSTSVVRTVTIVFNSTPTATLTMEMVGTNYAVARGADGNVTLTADFELASGTAPTWS